MKEIIAAGAAGGGYIEYHYDDPAIDGDEDIGSPKIGYATGSRLPGRNRIFVVGSAI